MYGAEKYQGGDTSDATSWRIGRRPSVGGKIMTRSTISKSKPTAIGAHLQGMLRVERMEPAASFHVRKPHQAHDHHMAEDQPAQEHGQQLGMEVVEPQQRDTRDFFTTAQQIQRAACR